MACIYCDFKGVIQGTRLYNGREYPSVTMCSHCKDEKAYSEYIRVSMRTRQTQEEIFEERKQAKFSNRPFLSLLKGDKNE